MSSLGTEGATGARRGVRLSVLLVLLALLAGFVIRVGVPTDRSQVMLGCLVLAVALAAGRPDRSWLAALRAWLALGLLLYAYDLGRGAAGRLGMEVQYVVPARIDAFLFGGIPTVWLQRHLYTHGAQVQWWEPLIALVYLSHFVLPYVAAAVFWARSAARGATWVRRFVVLTAIALLCFALLPTAPPWLASQSGVIDPVERTVAHGFSVLHLHAAGRWVAEGQEQSNLTAAFPSLHAAYTMLLLLMVWPKSRWWVRVLLVGYVAAMAFTLVVSAEHWVGDVLAGWLVAGLATWVVTRYERVRFGAAGD